MDVEVVRQAIDYLDRTSKNNNWAVVRHYLVTMEQMIAQLTEALKNGAGAKEVTTGIQGNSSTEPDEGIQLPNP